MTKIVYVTGCAGFIGFYVAQACLEQGWYVRGIDLETYAHDPINIQKLKNYPKFEYEHLDINHLDRIYDCDYVINLAAETHVDNSIVENSQFLHSNVNGVHKLLTLIQKKSAFKQPILLHFSTDEVYGDINVGEHTENDLLKPSNPYSATKAAADHLITAWHRTYGNPYVIVRPTNNYGIGQYSEKFIPKTIKYLQLGRRVPLHENGTPVRTWLHVEDTANAVIHIINQGLINQTFNISGNYQDSNLHVFEKICNCFGLSSDLREYIDFDVSRIGQDVRYAIDDSKLKFTGWKNTRIFDNEIPNVVSYHREHFKW